jgi:hypothetical protein
MSRCQAVRQVVIEIQFPKEKVSRYFETPIDIYAKCKHQKLDNKEPSGREALALAIRHLLLAIFLPSVVQ